MTKLRSATRSASLEQRGETPVDALLAERAPSSPVRGRVSAPVAPCLTKGGTIVVKQAQADLTLET